MAPPGGRVMECAAGIPRMNSSSSPGPPPCPAASMTARAPANSPSDRHSSPERGALGDRPGAEIHQGRRDAHVRKPPHGEPDGGFPGLSSGRTRDQLVLKTRQRFTSLGHAERANATSAFPFIGLSCRGVRRAQGRFAAVARKDHLFASRRGGIRRDRRLHFRNRHCSRPGCSTR